MGKFFKQTQQGFEQFKYHLIVEALLKGINELKYYFAFLLKVR